MAEKLTLQFSVGKDGVVNLQQIAATMRSVDKEVNRTNTDLGSMAEKLQAAVLVTGLNQALSMVQRLASAVQWLGKNIEEGIEANRAAEAFNTMAFAAGESADAIRGMLQAATGGEVAMTTLEQWSNQLTEITGNLKQSATIIAYAYEYSAATGRNAERVIRGLSGAIASGSAESAARLGVFADKTYSIQLAAESAGVGVKFLTDEEKKNAVAAGLTAAMNLKLGESTEFVGHNYKQATAVLADFKSMVQQGLAGGAPAGLQDWVGQLLFEPSEIDERIKRLGDLRESIADYQRLLNLGRTGGLTSEADSRRLVRLQQDFGSLRDAIKMVGIASLAMNKDIQAAFDAVRKATEIAQKIKPLELVADPSAASQALSAIASRMDTLRSAIDAVDAVKDWLPESMVASVESYRSALNALGVEYDKIGGWMLQLDSATPQFTQDLRDQYQALVDAGQGATEQAKTLKALADASAIAAGGSQQVFDTLAKFSKLQEVDLAERLGLDSDVIPEAAAALMDVAKAKADLDKALSSGDVDAASIALAEYGTQAASAETRLRSMGVEESNVSTVTDALTTSMRGYQMQLEASAASTYDAEKAWRDLESAIRDMQALSEGVSPGFLGVSTGTKPVRKTKASSAPQDMTERQFALEKTAMSDGLSEMERLRAEHEARMNAIMEANAKTPRKLEIARLEEEKTYQGQVDQLRERQAALDAQYTAEADRAMRDAQQVREQYAQDAIRKAQALERARLDLAVVTGELTTAEAGLERVRIDASDPNLSATDRAIAQVREQIAIEGIHREALMEKAETFRYLAGAMSDAMATMQGLASLSGDTLDPKLVHVASSMQKFGASVGDFIAAGGDAKQIGSAVAGMSGAIGSAVAGFAGSARESAAIMAAFAAATAVYFAFTPGMQALAAGQAAAALQYAIIAGLTGTGGKKSSSARATGTQSSSGAASGSTSLTVIFQGQPLATRDDVQRAVVSAVVEARKAGVSV